LIKEFLNVIVKEILDNYLTVFMLLERQSDHKMSLFAVFIIALSAGIFFLAYGMIIDEPATDNPGMAACTQEAKLCPDGSSVGRTGPKCEFAVCPTGKKVSAESAIEQIKKSSVEYLLTQKQFSWKTRENSINFCQIENLGEEIAVFPIYVWVHCGEYVLTGGQAEEASGSSGPVKISYSGELSNYDLSKFSHEAPGDGARYQADIEKIFPQDIQEKISAYDRDSISQKSLEAAVIGFADWESVKQAIVNCEAEQVMQAHSKKVSVILKSGKPLSAVEPEIDDILQLVDDAELKCGKILMITE
jgi:hypothetical protein